MFKLIFTCSFLISCVALFATDYTGSVSYDVACVSYPTIIVLPPGTYTVTANSISEINNTIGISDLSDTTGVTASLLVAATNPGFGVPASTSITLTEQKRIVAMAAWATLGYPKAYSVTITGDNLPGPPVWHNKPYHYYIDVSNPQNLLWTIDLNSLCTGAETYQAQGLPNNMTLAGTSLVWDPVTFANGDYSFTVNASNAAGVSGASFTITVTGAGADNKPKFTGSLNFDAYKGSPVDFNCLVAFSNYGSSFTISAGSGFPSWAAMSAGFIVGTCPANETAQNYVFTVTCSNQFGSASGQCTITIRDIVVNDLLKITSPSAVTATGTISYTPTTNKSNATISVSGLPSGITYSGGTVSGTIPSGITSFSFTVSATAPECTPTSMVVQVSCISGDSPGNGKHVIVDNFADNKANFADLENGVRQTNSYLSRVATDIEGVKGSLDYLNQLMPDKNTISSINTNTTAINANLNTISSNVSSINTKLDTTNNYLSGVSTSIEGVGSKVSLLNTTLGLVKNDTANIQQETTQINGGVNSINGKLDQSLTKQDTANDHLASIDNTTKHMDGTLDGIKTSLDKIDLTKVIENQQKEIDKLGEIKTTLTESLDVTVDPDSGYEKEVLTVVPGDYGVLVNFQNVLSPKGCTPPPVKIPLSALNDNLPSFLNAGLQDYNVDFSQPPISTLFGVVRLAETILMTIAILILGFRAIRTFEF